MKLLNKTKSIFQGDIFNRFKRKLTEIYELSHSSNIHLRPTGIYESSKEYYNRQKEAGAEYFEIYPRYESTLVISKEMYDAVSGYAKPKLSITTDYIVVKIPKGRVYTNNMGSVAIISDDNKVIGDVSFQYKNGKVIRPEENIIFSQKHFVKPMKLQGTMFSMISGGGAINNYGHWLMDSIPRLHLLKESGLFSQIDWFLVPSLLYDYQRQTLNLLGIPESKIIEGDKIRHIETDFLVASTAPRGNDTLIPTWMFTFLRESFANNATFSTKYPLRIHVSRKDSKFRRVLNEEKLVDMIEPLGFKTVLLSEYSFEEKVNLFANAEVVLGASGAGLVNVFFCRKGTKLIELFSEGFVFPDNLDVSNKGELDYSYLISKSLSEVETKSQGQRDSMVVDLVKLKTLLEENL